jgi:hypothetical protein
MRISPDGLEPFVAVPLRKLDNPDAVDTLYPEGSKAG